MSARRALSRLRYTSRIATGRLRLLPDFLIIGAQRCGTSSLYRYLGAHPEITSSTQKEVDYFSYAYDRGETWYRSHFPLRARRSVERLLRRRGLLTFEATPFYLLDPRAPARARRLLPDAKLIVLVRDPVGRAYSHYLHNLALGHEPLSFEEAVDAEPFRVNGELQRMVEDPTYQSVPLRRFSYVTRSLYVEQLERWLEEYPMEHLLVVKSEALYARTAEVFHDVLAFLDVSRWEPPRFRNFSSRRQAGSDRPNLSEATRGRLVDLFAPHNQRLSSLLDRELGWEGNLEPGNGQSSVG
ncbi:MAG: sulfotransferase family protein [Acidimicrobiia bacterium]